MRFEDFRAAVRDRMGDTVPPPAIPADAARGLKFSEALPDDLVSRTVGERMGDAVRAGAVLRQRVSRLAAGTRLGMV